MIQLPGKIPKAAACFEEIAAAADRLVVSGPVVSRHVVSLTFGLLDTWTFGHLVFGTNELLDIWPF